MGTICKKSMTRDHLTWCSRLESNHDLLLTKEVLYRLSYVSSYLAVSMMQEQTGIHADSRQLKIASSSVERETGIEPAQSAWKAEVLPLNYSRAGTT